MTDITVVADPIDLKLLDAWQRDFPVCSKPYEVLAKACGTNQDDAIMRLSRMQAAGRITRIGATCAPNTVSASTLAAVSVPAFRLDEVAEIIGAQPGVNHNYLREDKWNLWFVATGPDRAHVDATLTRIEAQTGLKVLDLRLLRPFNVDLGFRMTGPRNHLYAPRPAKIEMMVPGDRDLLQQLMQGLSLCRRPYGELAAELGCSEALVMQRITALVQAGIISRFGVIVRHRALGWSANAMVVWDLPSEAIDAAGPKLAALSGVTLCYERRPAPGIWPYRLYNMIHARSRDEAQAVLTQARALPELVGIPHKVLFSTRCFRQTGALIATQKEAAA